MPETIPTSKDKKKNGLNPMSLLSLLANRENITWVFHKGKYKLWKETANENLVQMNSKSVPIITAIYLASL